MSKLPDYVASSQPNPQSSRVGWLTTTAASYAGVMLWFAFWQFIPNVDSPYPGGILSQGLPLAIGSLVLAAFLCHFLFYLVPGLLGMKTGLTLTIVGTSTFGTKGGFIMPGFLMGVLQFGWLSVNAYFAGLLLAGIFDPGAKEMGVLHLGIGVAWILVAIFVGMKGVQYVGAVASFTPILPIIVLGLMIAKTIGGVGEFSVDKLMAAETAKAGGPVEGVKLYGSAVLGVVSLVCAYVIGFFATAGAAGVGFGSANKDAKSIQYAGLVGIVLATCFTGIAALLIFAGAQSQLQPEMLTTYHIPSLFNKILGDGMGKICMLLLCIAAFPSACFPTLVAADAFKTTFPKINPLITCGLGVLGAILLTVTGLAGKAGGVFTVIGASFGPICGAMAADYLLAGRRWAGPRDGFNMPGWIAWFFGFLVGGATLVVEGFLGGKMLVAIPCPPLSAFLVGFVLYALCAKMGMESKVLEMPQRIDLDAAEPE